MKDVYAAKNSLHSSSENHSKITPSSSALTLTPEQLEEALEERVSRDRRRKQRTLPDSVIDRRIGERRKESS